MDAPAALADTVPARFDDDARPLYGQAATVRPDGLPAVRTVHFRYIRTLDRLGFACHTGSPKWAELAGSPRAACCTFNPRRGVQLRWEAEVRLEAVPASAAARELWQRTAPWLRAEYGAGEEPPPCFGVAVLEVSLWDRYEVDPTDPAKNSRTVYRRRGGVWVEERRGALY
ncbi:MAG: pyridoxamine 5'-phosphate oxidase family protein [Elusimicrobia bacterium]|nr:pyridoxamine 5'-phosphate oxidase family protein [Elusimicrobiota bacterium]